MTNLNSIHCELCGEVNAPDKTLCAGHEQDLEYFAAYEYNLNYIPDFVRAEWLEQKKKELLG